MSCTEGGNCLCLGSLKCKCDDDCRDGEVCSGVEAEPLCFGPKYLNTIEGATHIPCPGLTGATCREDNACLDDRICRAGGGDNCVFDDILCDSAVLRCSDDDRVCYCFKEQSCSCEMGCAGEEVCAKFPSGGKCVVQRIVDSSGFLNLISCEDDDSGSVIVPGPEEPEPSDLPQDEEELTPTVLPDSNEPEPNEPEPNEPEPAEEAVCVDADALDGLDLVFREHVRGNVLCDSFGSCATAGHIVTFRNNAMMMKTYCGIVGCTRKLMLVNSPRRVRGLRVPSRTDGLEYTAFAARYATRAEEVVLTIAVRVGL